MPESLYCTTVSPECSVEATIYGYTPSLGFNAFFLAFFTLAAIYHLAVSIRYKTYFFGIAITIGCLGEVTGYIGRILLHDNAWSDIGFEIQISCLIFSPSFVVAKKSRIPARFYTWVFITFDILSLLLQAIGGGIAASAGENEKTRDLGTNLMIAGIVWQVFTLIVFAALVIDYVLRTRKSWDRVPEETRIMAAKRPFKLFCAGISVAFVTIFARCVYRIAEMVQGWANPIMRDEAGFIVMEGFMIVIALSSLAIFHPGWCFPQISKGAQTNGESVEKARLGSKSDSL
ncbi:hypothetical protein BOTNAR_0722g00030 [Botryotinia narcissicola]|uniref:RTA1 domain protein n=1 Tax=Botryotinia narcissicola TaxID=278944 RepID=A0A4Z1HBS1_9HELO|nr:hypothetical protein BOTNAR_0722g00030 [Botryotinia narcissicola]